MAPFLKTNVSIAKFANDFFLLFTANSRISSISFKTTLKNAHSLFFCSHHQLQNIWCKFQIMAPCGSFATHGSPWALCSLWHPKFMITLGNPALEQCFFTFYWCFTPFRKVIAKFTPFWKVITNLPPIYKIVFKFEKKWSIFWTLSLLIIKNRKI